MRKIIPVFLAILMLFSCSTSAYATTATSNAVDSIHDIVVDMYDAAESAPQQTSAAAMGSMYMLNIILKEMSSNQTRINAGDNIVSTISDQIGKLDGAPQVSAVSLFGCVYLLSGIAYELDSWGLYSDAIKSTVDNLSSADTSSAVQEMALAAYRMVDMLAIIALEQGVSSQIVTSIDQLLRDNDKSVSGAPQQTANGLYRSAELLYFISQEDCSSWAANRISDTLDNMYSDNDKCESAVQQTSNGMASVYLMLYTIAQDKA